MKKIKKKSKSCLPYLMIIITIALVTFNSYINSNNKITSTNIFNALLSDSNKNIMTKDDNIFSNISSFISKININNPISFLNSGLMLEQEHIDDYSNLEQLKKISFHMNNPNEVSVDEPLVYIYNTHQIENYSCKNFNEYNVTPNVLMASYILQENLLARQIPTIVEEADFTKELNDKGYKYWQSYQISREYVLKVQKRYPSIKYFIW